MAIYNNVNGTIRETNHKYENVNGTIKEVNAKYQNVNGNIYQTFSGGRVDLIVNGAIVDTNWIDNFQLYGSDSVSEYAWIRNLDGSSTFTKDGVTYLGIYEEDCITLNSGTYITCRNIICFFKKEVPRKYKIGIKFCLAKELGPGIRYDIASTTNTISSADGGGIVTSSNFFQNEVSGSAGSIYPLPFTTYELLLNNDGKAYPSSTTNDPTWAVRLYLGTSPKSGNWRSYLIIGISDLWLEQ